MHLRKAVLCITVLLAFLFIDCCTALVPWAYSTRNTCSLAARHVARKSGQPQKTSSKINPVKELLGSPQDPAMNALEESLKRQRQQQQQKSRIDSLHQVILSNPSNIDAMRARAALLRTSILKQQLELQNLERQIICCSQGQIFSDENNPTLQLQLQKLINTFTSSTNVLLRKLSRVQAKIGPSNQQWKNVGEYVASQTATGARIVGGLVQNPQRLKYFVDPETPTLVPHVPAILARLDKLEVHVNPILERVLNNRRHLASIEPYLDDILERFDDIEPHLPWILDNIDTLAPYCGLLLKHIDELLLYADADDYSNDCGDNKGENGYALAEQLLPYLEYYVSRLDVIGPHLPLLRPHVPQLLRNNRIGNISPHIDRLFARGYQDLSASANMDVLLFWFGWTLRIPGLPRAFFAIPGSPRIVSFLANRLPKRFVRGYCRNVTCLVDNDYGRNWNQLRKKEF